MRARSVLSPAEAVLLATLLAPVADHAAGHHLQQVDLSVSSIQLVSADVEAVANRTTLLQKPLTQWEELRVKVAAIDFSGTPTDSATWAGDATIVQGKSDGGPRASYLGMLRLLIYEVLGGPRSTVESTGRYTPIAGLTELGNAVLRRGLIDDLPSAMELARLLSQEVTGRRGDGQGLAPISVTPQSTRASAVPAQGDASLNGISGSRLCGPWLRCANICGRNQSSARILKRFQECGTSSFAKQVYHTSFAGRTWSKQDS